MINYPYENLNDEEFENLVIRICKEVIGIGCKTFSTGKDGAKDSWFVGTANAYPSKTNPWTGSFIIQAKHTKEQNSSCSDNDFSVNRTSILAKEISRLIEIQKTTPFDNYLIFTNRKLPGMAHSNIVNMLQAQLRITNTEIFGREQIDAYLDDYPQIADQFGLSLYTTPLRFYEKDLKDVILVFSRNSKDIAGSTDSYIKNFNIVEKEKKNKLNNLSEDYFTFIKNHSLQYFETIESFLRDPKNDQYTKMYSNTVSDLQEVITIERDHFKQFEQIIKHIYDYTVEKHEAELRDIRQIVRVFIHFMYFNCDIGKTR